MNLFGLDNAETELESFKEVVGNLGVDDGVDFAHHGQLVVGVAQGLRHHRREQSTF